MKAAPFACALLFVSPAQLWAPDVVSTAQSEVRITFSPDGRRSGVYFFSNREGGFGKDDIYFASFDARAGTYGAARNLGAAINSISTHDPDALYFTSEHAEGRGRADIYRIDYRLQR